MEDFPVGVSPPRVEVGVREGGAARVECGSPQSVPDAQLTFFRDGREVDADAAPEGMALDGVLWRFLNLLRCDRL